MCGELLFLTEIMNWAHFLLISTLQSLIVYATTSLAQRPYATSTRTRLVRLSYVLAFTATTIARIGMWWWTRLWIMMTEIRWKRLVVTYYLSLRIMVTMELPNLEQPVNASRIVLGDIENKMWERVPWTSESKMAGNRYLGWSWYKALNRKRSCSERKLCVVNCFFERKLTDLA